MLDICSNDAAELDIDFNAKKSPNLFAVGKLFHSNLLSSHLGSDVICWRESEVFGLSFKAGKNFNCGCSHTKYVFGDTKLFFFESNCQPLITYGCEALNFNSHIIHQLSACWNNA